MSDSKLCPYCAEEVKSAAIKCKHCGEMLGESSTSVAAEEVVSLPPAAPVVAAPDKPVTVSPAGIFAAIVLVFCLVMAGVHLSKNSDVLASSGSGSTGAAAAASGGMHSVTYRVTGRGEIGASLTYQNASGGTDQKKVSLPWSETFQAASGSFLYVAAQKESKYGALDVTIEVDGAAIQKASADDEYGIASASGSI